MFARDVQLKIAIKYIAIYCKNILIFKICNINIFILKVAIYCNAENENVPDNFASVILKKRQKLCPVTKYVDCRFLLPTSNLLERFFSTAGYASSDLRQRLLPANLEEQLFLKINKRYWDQKTVNCALSS